MSELRVTQTILADDPPAGLTANCLQAAMASLLGLALGSVPHFAEYGEQWEQEMYDWCWDSGYAVVCRSGKASVERGIAVGVSPRGEKHAMVMVNGELVWDPHPDRNGLYSVEKVYALVPLTDED
jgi:hypothetical protein